MVLNINQRTGNGNSSLTAIKLKDISDVELEYNENSNIKL